MKGGVKEKGEVGEQRSRSGQTEWSRQGRNWEQVCEYV